MANVTISQLTAATTLIGTEEVAIVQNNATLKTTAQNIANLYNGGLGSLEINADGSIGNTVVGYTIQAVVPTNYTGGDIECPIEASPSINLYGQYNGPFTATTIDFPTLTVAKEISLSSSTSIKDVSAQLLTYVTLNINVTNCAALESLDFPNLISASLLNLSSNNSSIPLSLNFPALVNSNLRLDTNSGVININSTSFPVLSVTSFQIYDTAVVTIDLPSITIVNDYTFLGPNTNLTTINLPNTVIIETSYIGSFYSTFSSLVNVSLGTAGTLKSAYNNMYIAFDGCVLNQASVDGLLTAFASLDGTNGTTPSSNGTLTLAGGNAAPSATGLAAKATLQGRGWTVSTN